MNCSSAGSVDIYVSAIARARVELESCSPEKVGDMLHR